MYPETVQSTGDRSKQSRKKKKKKKPVLLWSLHCSTEQKKKGLNDPDNHDNVVTYLEPDILECEVR